MKAIFKRTVLIAVSIFTASMLLFVGCNPTTSSSSNESKEEKEVDTSAPVISVFKAVAGMERVTLSWTVTDDEGVTSVKLYQGDAEGEESTELTEITSASTTSYEVSNLTNGTTYYFKLVASDEAGNTSEKTANARPAEEFILTSQEFAKQLTIGWNLGNTLDAASNDTSNEWCQGLNSETFWGQPKTTQEMIEAVYAAGFKTIRIPITWYNHVSGSEYKIDSEWMARVKTVVDWAYNAGFYVIMNVHHDNLSAANLNSFPGYGLSSNTSTQASIEEKSKDYLKKVWTQIAAEFNDDYGERLIFEVLNEPRTVGEISEWYADDTLGKTLNKIVTSYEQVCINAIRNSGSNNANRYIMVPAYKGSSSNINTYTLPNDTANDKLILSFHAYDPYNFAMYNKDYTDTTFDEADKSSLDSLFANVNKFFPSIGAVIGEASASNKDNLSDRKAWVAYYFDKAYNTYGWPTVMWDNGAYKADATSGEQHGWFNRKELTWYFPTVISAAMNAVGVTPGTLSQASETAN